MIVVDTTILVYAVGGDHPLADRCRTFVADVAAAEVRATTTVEVIQEFAHVRARRRGREDAVQLARSYRHLLHPLLSVSEDDLEAGLDRFSSDERLGAFDAVLAARTMRLGGVLASSDRAFAGIDGLTLLHPAQEDFTTAARGVAGR